MTIILQSGLVAAVAAVQTFFTALGTGTTVELGFLRRARRDNQGTGQANRVVFSPADDDGAAGTIVGTKLVGERSIRDTNGNAVATARALCDWQRTVTVSMWAVDTSDTTNEALQIQAIERLFEQTMRAVQGATGAFAEATWGDVSFTPVETRNFGLELRATLTYRQPLFDTPRNLVFPTTAEVNRAAYTPFPVPTSTGDT